MEISTHFQYFTPTLSLLQIKKQTTSSLHHHNENLYTIRLLVIYLYFMKKKTILTGVYIWIFAYFVFGQATNLGTPFILNYEKQSYQGGTQNWDILQMDNGLVYFANNEGLLEFNGINWTIFPIGNRTIVRSIAKGKNGRIYAGGQDEFGYYQGNKKGELVFTSLKNIIPTEHQRFEDVWNIVVLGDEVFFRASNKIYHFLSENEVKVYQTGKTIAYLTSLQQRIFVHDLELGLLELKNEQFDTISVQQSLIQNPIQSAIQWTKDTILFTTRKDGVFYLSSDDFNVWETPHDDFLKKNRIYTATKFGKQELALGTSSGGLIILNKHRKAIQWLSIKNGLQNNNILSIIADKAQNLWVGLDNGIDYLKVSEPFSAIYPDGDLNGTAYAAKVQGKNIYFGTSSGLYYSPWKTYFDPLKQKNFQLLNGTQGQVWGLENIQNQLVLGHHEGSFIIENNQAVNISQLNGAWTFLPIDNQENYMINGTYTGISLFQKNESKNWKFVKELEELQESCRLMIQDPAGYFWIAHPYRGVYKVKIDLKEAKITEQKLYSIEEKNPHNVFKINKEVVFAAKEGIVRYLPEVDSFVPYPVYNDLLGKHAHTKRLVEAPNGNIWFITDKEIGVLKMKDTGVKKTFEKVLFPELQGQLVGGFEFIYPFNKDNVFFGAEKGFIHYNPSKILEKNNLNVLLTKVQILNEQDSLIFGGHTQHSDLTHEAFPSNWNNIRFHFAAPWFSNLKQIKYQYYLEGLETEWQNWTSMTQKGYTNLNPGKYTFKLRAKNAREQESSIVTYSFYISPPWYASTFAYTLYALLFLGILVGIVWIPQKKFKEEIEQITEEQKRMEALHQQKLAKSQAALTQVKNETLQNQIEFKNKELVSATMHLVQKGELISKISQKLDQIAKNAKDAQTIKDIKQVIRLLHHDQILDEDWQQFTSHFDQVHSDFLKRLGKQFPNLTPKDYRLCAYLRMNLSTKEIALMMNISVRGVEVSRYRLRKKMELESRVNLTEYMMNF